jgi:hypothetical protein
MFISNSKISNNTGGYSVANIKGTARFDFIVFEQNVAQIGIEVYNELTLDEVTWTTNEAEWHLYVRPGGSLLVGSDSVISLNQATNGIFYLERKAICEVTNTEVKWNNVTEFHLISVLESSELKMIESTFVDNTVANVSLFLRSNLFIFPECLMLTLSFLYAVPSLCHGLVAGHCESGLFHSKHNRREYCTLLEKDNKRSDIISHHLFLFIEIPAQSHIIFHSDCKGRHNIRQYHWRKSGGR